MTIYACPIHPDVESDRLTSCPKCGMKLAVREDERTKTSDKKLSAPIRRAHLLGGLLILASAFACESKPERAPATVDDIKATPLAFVGRTVTVSGEVDHVFSGDAFELEGDGIIWDKTLLVLTRSPVQFGPHRVTDDNEVIVRGTVRRMSVAEIERELGRDLPADVETRFLNQPVMIADSVRLFETGYTWSEGQREGAVVSVMKIMSEVAPKLLAGTTVQLDDIPVQAKAPRGLWIGSSPRSQLFVVPKDTTVLGQIEVGDVVDLKGTLRELPAIGDAVKQFELDAVSSARMTSEALYIEATELNESEPRPST